MKIALIENNIVEQIKVGNTAKFPGWNDVTGKYVGVGFTDNGDGTFTDNRPPKPVAAIRKITTKAFYRRLSFNERKILRNSPADAVIDLREDLQRGLTVDLDGTIEQQLLDTKLLSQIRVDELLVDGEEAEL